MLNPLDSPERVACGANELGESVDSTTIAVMFTFKMSSLIDGNHNEDGGGDTDTGRPSAASVTTTSPAGQSQEDNHGQPDRNYDQYEQADVCLNDYIKHDHHSPEAYPETKLHAPDDGCKEPTESIYSSVYPSPFRPLNILEKKFLLSVERGDLPAVKRYKPDANTNFNCTFSCAASTTDVD